MGLRHRRMVKVARDSIMLEERIGVGGNRSRNKMETIVVLKGINRRKGEFQHEQDMVGGGEC